MNLLTSNNAHFYFTKIVKCKKNKIGVDLCIVIGYNPFYKICILRKK
nr:MAG TPA: hypothetical protein [Caudoviricetes sp.]DAT36801.1 MAG TPA: hypothetical protein [Caudoviricetes sp.]